MLFGTYNNPKEWNLNCGFTPKREEKRIDIDV